MNIRAVLFDLDDTLYPESEYVKSGYNAVEKEVEAIYGLKDAAKELIDLFEKDKLKVFDRYLERHGLPRTEQSILRLVDAYRNHVPNIELYENVLPTLCELRKRKYKLGIITDGDVSRQRLKIEALQLNGLVDNVIITNEIGGSQFNKPHPKAFEIMCAAFAVKPDEAIYIGDNPQKDFAIKRYLPIRTIRITSQGGMYSDCGYRYGIEPDYTINDIKTLLDILEIL